MNPNRRQALLGMAAAPLVTSLGPSHAKANQPAGSHLPHAKPEEIGLNPGQLERAYELLEGWTAGANGSGTSIGLQPHGLFARPATGARSESQ